jgi:hypothetical protein
VAGLRYSGSPPPTEGVVTLYTKVRTTEDLEAYTDGAYIESECFVVRERC